MKIISSNVDLFSHKKRCLVIIGTTNGDVHMYGEAGGNVIPASWNKDKFITLPEDERTLLIKLVRKEIKKFKL